MLPERLPTTAPIGTESRSTLQDFLGSDTFIVSSSPRRLRHARDDRLELAGKGFGHPRIDTYANNDGWFDDTSDGPVMARLVMYSPEVSRLRYIDVEYPAWVMAAYPRYCPEILDIITLDEVVEDVAIREFAARPDVYGPAGSFGNPKPVDPTDLGALAHWKVSRLEWNSSYRPWFYRDIWPILFRADEMNFVTNVLQQSNFPHSQTSRGNFDPNIL
jgi:hypothetical protein